MGHRQKKTQDSSEFWDDLSTAVPPGLPTKRPLMALWQALCLGNGASGLPYRLMHSGSQLWQETGHSLPPARTVRRLSEGRVDVHSAVIAFAMETQLALNRVHPITKQAACQACAEAQNCTAFVFLDTACRSAVCPPRPFPGLASRRILQSDAAPALDFSPSWAIMCARRCTQI